MRLLIAIALIAGCEKTQQASPPPPPTPVVEQPPAAAPKPFIASDLPAECAEYGRAIDGLAKCEKFPKQSIDALKQGFEAMSRGWGDNRSMSAEARTAMASACKAGTDAVKQAASAMCGVEQMPELATDAPRECEEYRRITNLVVSCEKLQPEVRKALKQAYDAISTSWSRDRSLPPEAVRALGASCKQATDALRQVAADSCDLQ